MAFTTLLTEDAGNVRFVTVNRPDKLNALNRTVVEELGRAVQEAAESEDVRVLVITGSGPKAFVAGADIAEFQGLDAPRARALAARGQAVLDRIEAMEKPVIAAVNGFALGGGCELAMACHLRIASENARFGQPEVKLGLIPGYGGTQRLPRLVGRGRALELLVTGGMIDAPTALAWGLVNRVVPADALRDEVMALAGQILAVSPAAVGRCLEAVRRGLECPLSQGLASEAALFALGAGTEDWVEGVGAFLEKRAPSFTGR